MGERFQGGRLAARAIAANGVDTIFTLSGGHVMPIYEGCRLEGVRVVDVRHEQAAAHAAEAWGRVRRTCGVAVATAGPGVTGTVTAVANSFAAQTPLVVFGAERPVVIGGSGIWWDGAWKQLAAFAENGRFPIYLNGSGRGSLPPGHELFFQHSRGAALEAADVVCVLGTPLDFRLRFGRFNPD